MKWFHHECAAKHDPKLEMLGTSFGAEGLGIYWGLLEEIGAHSDNFHLKVSGLSTKVDRKFDTSCRKPSPKGTNLSRSGADATRIPRFSLKILTRVLYTTPSRLSAVIKECVSIGLFDQAKWRNFNVLYSPGFEERADDYTRRQVRRTEPLRQVSEKRPNTVRTMSEHSPKSLRTISAKVPLEQHRQEQKKKRREKKMLSVNVDNQNDLSTSSHTCAIHPEDPVDLTIEDFQRWCGELRNMITQWNDSHAGKVIWLPGEGELRKLLYGGDDDHKRRLCLQAINLLGEGVTYPQIVKRALMLMLEASERTRISNPFGWLWVCLHGSGDGTSPWVQLVTAQEEASGPARRRKGGGGVLFPLPRSGLDASDDPLLAVSNGLRNQ